jgi:hypothetical protein
MRNNPAANDLAVRTATMDALRAENQALLEQILGETAGSGVPLPPSSTSTSTCAISLLSDETGTGSETGAETGGPEGSGGAPCSSSSTCPPLETFTRLSLENKTLRDSVSSAAKRLERTKEVYRLKAKEYREVVFSLLGYLMDFYPDGRVKLTSAYRPGLAFEFRSLEEEEEEEEDDEKVEGDKKSKNKDCGSINVVNGDAWVLERMRHYVQDRGCVPAFLSAVTLGLAER